MPVLKCPNGLYRIGSGPCMYKSKASAERAYAAYRAKSHSEAPRDDRIYARYTCSRCKSERLLPKEQGLPIILMCRNCEGFMKPEVTVLLKSDHPESRYSEVIGFKTLFFEELQEADEVLPLGEGEVELVSREEDGKWRTIAVRFKDSWNNEKIRRWMWYRFPIVRLESTQNLSNIPMTLRKIFQNRQGLFNEWREYYIASLGMPLPNLLAWHELSQRWMKDGTGRWTRR